jgi:streptogramin lyase
MKSRARSATTRKSRRPAALAWSAALAFGAGTAQGTTWTTSADFAAGILTGVEGASVADQLQLERELRSYDFLWIPMSGRGTVLRVDARTGAIAGEYRTAPDGRGRDPSRTAVDAAGNVWVGNRGETAATGGSVVQLGLVLGGTRVRRNADGSTTADPAGAYLAPPFDYCSCRDRNGDGLVRTSRGARDVLAWPDAGDGAGGAEAWVENAEDECIRLYQRTSSPATHHVSVAPSGDVWVGSFPGAVFDRLDGANGRILETVPMPAGGYGGYIDADGILWSSSYSRNLLLRYDTRSGESHTTPVTWSYGLAPDAAGHVWNTMWSANTVAKLDQNGNMLSGFPSPSYGGGSSGVVVTPDGQVWIANANTNTVTRLAGDGALLKRLTVASGPQALDLDRNGKLWVVSKVASTAQRIDPRGGSDGLGAVDLTVTLGSGLGPQPYGSMSGSVVGGMRLASGAWSVVEDGRRTGAAWGELVWTSAEPSGTRLDVRVRAADSEAALAGANWVAVANGADLRLRGVRGRYLAIEVGFSRLPAVDASPVLFDVAISTNTPPDCAAAQPSVEEIWPPDQRMVAVEVLGLTDPDGDPVQCTITGITQDEPVVGRGAGATVPDGEGVGSGQARLRAERAGNGSGRTYEIHFLAEDGRGGECRGTVRVCVPHDRGGGRDCAGGPQIYDSTADPGLESWLYPNPFNPVTTIGYVLSRDANVRLAVYDVLGRAVRVLVQGSQPAGEHRILWDGRDAQGQSMSSGVYVYRLDAGTLHQSGRMLLVK